MRQLALRGGSSPVVRQLAERICGGIHSKDYVSEAIAIYNYVCTQVRYTRDPRTVELIRAPWLLAQRLLRGERPSGDCDDQACLIAALLLAVGAQTFFVTVAFKKMVYRGEVQYSHVIAGAIDPRTQTPILLDTVAGPKTLDMLRRVQVAKVWPVA